MYITAINPATFDVLMDIVQHVTQHTITPIERGKIQNQFSQATLRRFCSGVTCRGVQCHNIVYAKKYCYVHDPNTSLPRCIGTTKKGERCRLRVPQDGMSCHLHKDQDPPKDTPIEKTSPNVGGIPSTEETHRTLGGISTLSTEEEIPTPQPHPSSPPPYSEVMIEKTSPNVGGISTLATPDPDPEPSCPPSPLPSLKGRSNTETLYRPDPSSEAMLDQYIEKVKSGQIVAKKPPRPQDDPNYIPPSFVRYLRESMTELVDKMISEQHH